VELPKAFGNPPPPPKDSQVVSKTILFSGKLRLESVPTKYKGKNGPVLY
jgi:hypothetical protein